MHLYFDRINIERFKAYRAPATLNLRKMGQGLWYVSGVNQVSQRLGSNGCLVGDTMIDCPRDLLEYPKGVPLKNLVGSRNFLTYSWDESARTLVLSRVKRVWRTGRKKVYRVRVSAYSDNRNSVGRRNGGSDIGRFLPPCEIVGTADHPIMLSDGSWVALAKLKPGDSLMSLYRRDADRGLLWWTGKRKPVSEQQFVCTAKNGPRPVNCDVHHVDKNKYNHSPSNVIWKDKIEHQSDHARERRSNGEFIGWLSDGVHPQGMLGKKHAKKTKVRIAKTMQRRWAEDREPRVVAARDAGKLRSAKLGWRINSKPWLLRHYVHKEMTAPAIATVLGCTDSTVYNRLAQFGIERRKYPNHNVVDVKFVGYEDVYDMEVENTHNFIANGVVVHNSGKSTLWDALCWCLYGRTVKGHRTPDLINWATGEIPDVSVSFAVGDAKDAENHVIQRTGKTNGLTLDGSTVTQDRVDEVVGLPFATFLHSIILGQSKPLFFDLTATGKMDVLTEALRLDRWDNYIATAKKQTDVLEREHGDKYSQLENLGRAVEAMDDQLDALKKKSDAWRLEQDNLKATREDEKLALEQNLKLYQRKLDDADLAYDSADTELRASQRAFDSAKELYRPIVQKRAQATAAFDAASEAERKAINARNKLVDADVCPHCGSRLDRKSIVRHREELDREVAAATKALNKAREVMYEAIAEDERAAEIEKGHSRDVRTFREKSNVAVDARTYAQSECNKLKAQINAMADRLDESDAQENPYNILLVDVRQKRKEHIKKERDLEDECLAISKRAGRVKYWVEGFKLLRLQLIDEMLAELEGVTQTLLASTGLEDWKVEYAIEKENKSGTTKPGLTVNIYQPEFDRPINWELFSGGEGQRLRIIGAVALSEVLLRRAGIVCDLLVLDEPTRHLSPEGVQDTISFLLERARHAQVIYTDHNAIETHRFAGVVKVTRTRKEGAVAVCQRN